MLNSEKAYLLYVDLQCINERFDPILSFGIKFIELFRVSAVQDSVFQFRQDTQVVEVICSILILGCDMMTVVFFHRDKFPRQITDTPDRTVFTDSEHG